MGMSMKLKSISGGNLMCGNNNGICGCINNNWWWIVILVLLFCNCGNTWGGNGCGNNGCYDGGNGCGNGCGCC